MAADNPTTNPASNPTRRAFVVGGVALAASATIGLAIKPYLAEADVLRPPGSVPEAEFIARCIKCNRCISVCPTQVLDPMGIEEGLLQVRTPRLNFSDNLCIFCDKCRRVCPTEAILKVDPHTPLEGRIGIAILHPDRCLAFLEAGSCGICIDACPYEALSFDENRRPVVDDQLCNGCGECVRICPANVLRSFSGGSVRGIEVITEKQYESTEDEAS